MSICTGATVSIMCCIDVTLRCHETWKIDPFSSMFPAKIYFFPARHVWLPGPAHFKMLEVAEPKGCLIRVHPCTCWFYNVLYRLQQFVQVHITSRCMDTLWYIPCRFRPSRCYVMWTCHKCHCHCHAVRASISGRAAGNFCDGHGDIAWLAQEAPLARDFSGQCQTATQTVGSGGLFEAQQGSSLAKWDFCPSWLFKGLANWMQHDTKNCPRLISASFFWRSLDEYDETCLRNISDSYDQGISRLNSLMLASQPSAKHGEAEGA